VTTSPPSLPPDHPLRPLELLLERAEADPEDLEPGTTLAELGGERLKALLVLVAGLLLDEELVEILPQLVPVASGLVEVPEERRRPRPKA
jgi:hypothetical protein